MKRRPLLLMVLDGFGCREAVDHNAVKAHSAYFHGLLERYPHALLSASGKEVGLPLGLMGNSEVGHLNLGAGRIVHQDISRINNAIRDGSFDENGALAGLMDRVRERGSALHLLGLIGTGGVHASEDHLRRLLKMAAARGLARDRVLVHAITDGRDTPPRSGAAFLEVLERDLRDAGVGRVASVVGRYHCMDRDNRWDRVQRAYELLLSGVGERRDAVQQALADSYEAGVGDEFVEPCVIGDPGQGRLADGDGLLCFNFRADRMRQICMALAFDDFDRFERRARVRLDLVTMTQYRGDFSFPVAFPPQRLTGLFSEVVSAAGLRQERIAETEKYAHVTYFFSGGNEAELPGESRTLVPSPRVATYDLQPEMSADLVCDRVLASLERGETDVYVVNLANADMVGHTGVWEAACVAIEAVDRCLERIVPEVVRRGGVAAITADHGNAEMLWDERNDMPHTAHTTNPVPIVLCSDALVGQSLRAGGILADVAPTLIELGGLEKPEEMDGVSLLAPSRVEG